MGTDFTAVVNHNLGGKQLFTLPELLNSTWRQVQHFLPILEGYPVPGYSGAKKWQWREEENITLSERLHNHGTVIIESYEFHGFVSRQVFRIGHGVSWWSFIADRGVRDKLLGVCRHIASALGSKQIIYLPSGFYKPEGALGLVHEGKSVDEMIDWLHANCGPPASNIESIYQEDGESWSGDGYYIDNM